MKHKPSIFSILRIFSASTLSCGNTKGSNLLIILLALFSSSELFAERFVILSDTQQPIPIERLWNRQWDRKEKNTEARDFLLNSILDEDITAVFFLGDLVGIGSHNKQWKTIDNFLYRLHERAIDVQAIPGNHEYLLFPKTGIKNFYKRFPDAENTVQVYTIDSVSVVLLNTNFKHLKEEQKKTEIERYEYTLDSLQQSQYVKKIIICSHQPPYTNSKKMKPDKEVQELLVPPYLSTEKAILFISGHSHNLEHFSEGGKDFLVAGGGGGIFQGIQEKENQNGMNRMAGDATIRYFYLLVNRDREDIQITVKGINPNDFNKIIEKQFVF